MDTVQYSDLLKIDLRTAKIVEVEDIEGKDKLLKLTIEIGEDKRTLVAGIKEFYSKDELMGKTIIVFTNLQPKNFGGIESKGMLLAADDKGKAILLTTDKDATSGSRIM